MRRWLSLRVCSFDRLRASAKGPWWRTAVQVGLMIAVPSIAGADPPPNESPTPHEPSAKESRFAIRGYATANYFAFDWETDPDRRNAFDLERLTLYPSVTLGSKTSAHAEIEFEHGGTGTTLEFDRFEEFGEFETDIEKGGEVLLEQLHLQYSWRPWLMLRAGRFKIPFGLQAVRDEPTEYFGTTRNEMESSLVPVNWYELGIQASGNVPLANGLTYSLSLVNGLDSTGFSSATWIVRGHQKRFETVNADDLAVAARLDWNLSPESLLGVSVYYGDSADNRPKPDLDVEAHVTVVDAHVAFEVHAVQARAVFIWGMLENADAVSAANRNLSNNLNVKRTPVGSEAWGVSCEAGYDLRSVLRVLPEPLVLYGRFDSYDTMSAVRGTVFDNPRWSRTVVSAGLNQHFGAKVVWKAEVSRRTLDLPDENVENTFSTGLGFEF